MMDRHILVILLAVTIVAATHGPGYDVDYHTSYHSQPYPVHHAPLVQPIQPSQIHGYYAVPVGHAVHPIPVQMYQPPPPLVKYRVKTHYHVF